MKRLAVSFHFSVAVVLVIALSSAGTAVAQNTEFGSGALPSPSSNLLWDSAFGFDALNSPTSGTGNTACGDAALQLNTAGAYNTASGFFALHTNTTGTWNTATGVVALDFNTTGSANTATGDDALMNNTTGWENTASGGDALGSNTTGFNNIALGYQAGYNLTTGSNNVDIGSLGVAAESNTIRIGTQNTQTDTFIAGIFGTPKIKKACEVVVESTGQLGCVKSSARYKRDIRDMGDASDKLMKLRPVTFRYKADSTGTQQYGLIAEEVEKVYPELVIDDTDGRAETVAYQILPAMLLNEVQKQARTDRRMARQLAQKDAQIAAMQRQVVALQKKNSEIDALSERINALEQQAREATPEHLASAMR